MALVSFFSGGYTLHRFSDAIGLVIVCDRICAIGDKLLMYICDLMIKYFHVWIDV